MLLPESNPALSKLKAAPPVTEVNRIAAVPDRIIRNLQITQCYCELSSAFSERTGPVANWCTFATWASKQAGRTIRSEDLKRTLEAMLQVDPEIEEALVLITGLAKQLGAGQRFEQVRQSALTSLVAAAAERAADAVRRGNKKVFEEIGGIFALFIAECMHDTAYNQVHIETFCNRLNRGAPPHGQDYLRSAFGRYYKSFFETDAKRRSEALFLANIEIGFHEQTRLQPEIYESLNTANIDPIRVKNHLLAILFPNTRPNAAPGLFLIGFLKKTLILDKAIGLLVQRAQHLLRRILTAHLMTLTLPPDNRLHLGRDLAAVYPANLLHLADKELIALLTRVDPTPDSLVQSGATDWTDLQERMHYITDLFRCYHENTALFNLAFNDKQVTALKAGKLPAGRL